ncbi:hypothetical protein [Geminisphaera colitermitum]|uniref:hypothetical protein n=1 Tax=Geminisphaera colitermitum TaxID=1148786 RepID=UPI0001964F5B|nr:hypothetical protein [Geminisphaera colitermitum]RRK02578.1 hypothetical protein Ga0100230_005545 [Opitutaceae bacterium TAV3]
MKSTRKNSAETQRGLRLWELRKRRAGLVAKIYLTRERDADRLLRLTQEAQTLSREIAELSGALEATA